MVLRQTCAAEGAGTNNELRSATRLSEALPLPERGVIDALRGTIGVTGASAKRASGTRPAKELSAAVPATGVGVIREVASVG
jgi:hypothetical protein